MKIHAAVVRELNKLSIEMVELAPPGNGEVLVKIRAAGVCHSDLHTLKGELRTVPPLVLGHEGAGIVEEVGPGVTSVRPGDSVLVNWLPADYTCPTCLRGFPNVCERLFKTTFQGLLPSGETRLTTNDGVKLKHYLGASTMADYAVLDQGSVIPIPSDVPFDVGAVIGCAVATGVGAVINTAQAIPGSVAAVIGCGGVGLAALQGCQLAGCRPIIAVDVVPGKLEIAKAMGATDIVNAKETNAVKAIRSVTKGGPDFIVDTVGSAITIPQAIQAVRMGGTAVVAGLHSANVEIPFVPGWLIFQNKQVRGSFAGQIRPHLDLPKLVELYRGGRLRLNELITKRYPLKDVESAFADMQAGTTARGVIIFE